MGQTLAKGNFRKLADCSLIITALALSQAAQAKRNKQDGAGQPATSLESKVDGDQISTLESEESSL